MDVSGITTASLLSQTRTEDAIQLAVLKKAMEMESQGALQLVQAATQSAGSSNPPNLGNQVDIFA